MTKSDIIYLTINQLVEKFYLHPESFLIPEPYSYNDDDHIRIVWRSQIHSGDELVEDPTMPQKTIVIEYNKIFKSLKIAIYNVNYITLALLLSRGDTGAITLKSRFIKFTKPYREFVKLQKLIKKHELDLENREFIKKLSNTLPSFLDHFLLGK